MSARITLRNTFYGGLLIFVGLGLIMKYFSSAPLYQSSQDAKQLAGTNSSVQPTAAPDPSSLMSNGPVGQTPAQIEAGSFSNLVGTVLNEGVKLVKVSATTPTTIQMDYQYVPGAQSIATSIMRSEFVTSYCDHSEMNDSSTRTAINVQMVFYASNGALLANLPTVGPWDCTSH